MKKPPGQGRRLADNAEISAGFDMDSLLCVRQDQRKTRRGRRGMNDEAAHAICIAIAMLIEDIETGSVTKSGFRQKIASAIASAKAQAPERGDDRNDFRVLRHLASMLDEESEPPTLRLVQ